MTDSKTKPVRYKELECIGDGFTFAGHRRADSKTIAEALEGTPSALEKVPLKRRKSWWGAQVRLYGLKGKDWTLDVCKAVLREALARGPLRVPTALIDAEERMNKEYHIKREQDSERYKKMIEEEKRKIIETDEKFRTASTDDEKARIDLRRFLQEKFGSEDITFFVLRDWGNRYGIEAMVRELGLFCAMTRGLRRPWNTILVVATTDNIAIRERDRIALEMKQEKLAMEQGEWNTLNKKRLELILAEGNRESPAGNWVLHMPELYDNNYWDPSDGECTIALPEYGPADESAYAKFEFNQFKGYFNIHLGKAEGNWQGVEFKVDWEGWGDDDGGEYDLETQHLASIMFTSASECRGTIDGWFGGPWKFKGVKVSHESEITADKCKTEYEYAKKNWDEDRADYFETNDPKKWYRRDQEEESEAEDEESMHEI